MKTLKRLLCLCLFLAAARAEAQITAFKTGEEQTGLTKQCYYAFGTTRYTRTVSSVTFCPLSITVPAAAPASRNRNPPPTAGLLAFKSGDETTGFSKQCFYNLGGSRYTKTVRSTGLCPLSIIVKP